MLELWDEKEICERSKNYDSKEKERLYAEISKKEAELHMTTRRRLSASKRQKDLMLAKNR